MANSSYRDEQSSLQHHHSIRVFTRPFLEYSTFYPAPSEQGPAPEGAPPDIVCCQLINHSRSSLDYGFRIAAMQHDHGRGGYVSLGGMRLLELCAMLLPEEAIRISVSYVFRREAYRAECGSSHHDRGIPVFPWTGFVMPGIELH